MSELQKSNHVSIIICHYERADDFGEGRAKPHNERGETRSYMMRRCLESLAQNTDYPAEVIVIDNGPENSKDSQYLLSLTDGGIINTYIRNKENMNFGWAWNQGAALATGDFLLFSCNDIYFEEGWLSETIQPLLSYPQEKYIATPIITPEKDNSKYNRGLVKGYRLNTLAGSNCMLMRRKTYEEVGKFSTHRIAGTHWHQRMNKLGYTVIATPENKVRHLAHEGGTNFHKTIEVKETLLNGETIKFST